MPNPLYRLIADRTGETSQVRMAALAGVDQTAISRWKNGLGFSTDNVLAVARALGMSPVEALVIVGLVRPDEAGAVTVEVERVITDEELLAELANRLAALRRRADAQAPQSQQGPGSSAGGPGAPIAVTRPDGGDPDRSGDPPAPSSDTHGYDPRLIGGILRQMGYEAGAEIPDATTEGRKSG